ncbi:MAG: phosphoglycerate kinase [Christensenella sp.]|nr:phosphoglycerate kinase [Christensenella sp.]
MKFGIYTIDDFDIAGKTVFCRIDINQPVDRARGVLKNTARIEACIQTLKELTEKACKLVLLAHQGSDIEYQNFYSTKPHAQVLSALLGKNVKFIDDVCGPAARSAIKELQNGEILLLDNVRFCSEEQTLFELKLKLTHEQQAQTQLISKLSPLADLYICDAFAAAHRDQPSLCGFEQRVPSAMGRLFEKEYCILSSLMEAPASPCVFVLGGAKVSDAFLMMETVLKQRVADQILTGGLVGNILLTAAGEEIGNGSTDFIFSSNYGEYIEIARCLLEKYPEQILLPCDLAYLHDEKRREANIGHIPSEITALDIGSKTIAQYINVLASAKTIFLNGPMGVFEDFRTDLGTKTIFHALAGAKGFTVIGGGDSVTAAAQYGVTGNIDYICTGGGALIRFLTGTELPVVRALRHAAAAFECDKTQH